MKGNILKWLIIFAVVAISGCAGKGAGPERTADELVTDGWSAYKGRNYQRALELFEEAAEKDPSYAEAYSGSGWANAKLDSLSSAVEAFNRCLDLDPQNLNAKAGLAFVYNAQNRYSESVTMAREVLEADPDWAFPYDPELDAGDLHLLIAQSWYALGEFKSSLAEVRVLNTQFTADVTTPEGRAALAAEIERLKEEV